MGDDLITELFFQVNLNTVFELQRGFNCFSIWGRSIEAVINVAVIVLIGGGNGGCVCLAIVF